MLTLTAKGMDYPLQQPSQRITGVYGNCHFELPRSIPDWVKRVKILVPDDETVVVRLIPKRLLEQSEREIVDGDGEYPLPGFYERVFGTKPTIHDKKALQSARIADYTISMCA